MSDYTAAGEWVTPERIDAIREEGRREVLDVVRVALPTSEYDLIESLVTGPPGSTDICSSVLSNAAGRSADG